MTITSELAAKFRRALRNRSGTSLTAAEVRHLAQLGVLHLLVKLEADELLSDVGISRDTLDAPAEEVSLSDLTKAAAAEELPRNFTVRMVADRWTCSEGLVRKLIADGSLEHFRHGSLIRIPLEAVLKREKVELRPGLDRSR